jgi:DNA-binding transcriptional MerR regulator
VLDEVFGGKNRIILPLQIDHSNLNTTHTLFLKIDEFLDKHGYSIETIKDYIEGKATKFKIDSDGKFIYDEKNPVKIGKLLQKYEDDGEIEVTTRKDGVKTTKKVIGKPLLHEFKNDPIRSANGEFLIVISRHPYDVAGSSTDRSWTSCINLGLEGVHYPTRRQGVNRRYVWSDVSEGTLVAYVVSKDELYKGAGGEDKVKLQRPLSRILIKPHNSDIGKLYTIGNMYGGAYSEFYNVVQKWISEKLNAKAKDVTDISVKRNPKLYSDWDNPVGFEFENLTEAAKVLAKRAKTISAKYKNSEIFVDYDEDDEEDLIRMYIIFKYNISNCYGFKKFKLNKKFKMNKELAKQIKNIFDPSDFYITLEVAEIIDNRNISNDIFNIQFKMEDEQITNLEYGQFALNTIDEYLEWVEQDVDPQICEIMQELGVLINVNESSQFDENYRKIIESIIFK